VAGQNPTVAPTAAPTPSPQQFATQSLLELRDGVARVLPEYKALQDKLNMALEAAFKALNLTPQGIGERENSKL
jgi:hypothetical protein